MMLFGTYVYFLFVSCVFAVSKRGIAAPWDSINSDLDKVPSSQKVSWLYNWESYRPTGGRQLEFVAMLRTAHRDDLARFYQNMPHNGARTLLCLNEPDHPEQANLSPQQAADIWRRHCWLQKTERGVRLGAPAITNGPQGVHWLHQFLELTRDTPPDFVTAHYYGVDGNDFIRHIQLVHELSQKPVWVTELAHVRDNIHDQRGFMQQVRRWMDEQWWIERYCWFSYSRGDHNIINQASRLLDRNGGLTDLFHKYVYDE